MRDTDSKFLFADRVPEAFRERVIAALKTDCTSAESAEYLRIANDAQHAALSVADGASPEHAALDVWIREVAILEAAKADADRADAGATLAVGTMSAPLDKKAQQRIGALLADLSFLLDDRQDEPEHASEPTPLIEFLGFRRGKVSLN